MTVIELSQDDDFGSELRKAEQKLVVVDFYATWCGPCNMIAPFYKQLSVNHPNVVFLKCDVDKCETTAQTNNVSAMPTFIFFKNSIEVDRIRGADKTQLENKIRIHSSSSSSSSSNNESNSSGQSKSSGASKDESQTQTGGYVDLSHLINKPQCECLNQSDDHTWENVLNNSTLNYLKSDVDEQLILFVSFNQTVKLHSLVIQGPLDNGPKTLKLFINQTRTLDFDTAERMEAIQEFELKPDDLKNNQVVNLRFVKFQNVQNLTLFFPNNQSGSDTTVISYIKFIGSTVNVTNMNEFKRVAGQPGESHG